MNIIFSLGYLIDIYLVKTAQLVAHQTGTRKVRGSNVISQQLSPLSLIDLILKKFIAELIDALASLKKGQYIINLLNFPTTVGLVCLLFFPLVPCICGNVRFGLGVTG